MNAPVKPTNFTNVKRKPLSQSAEREHRIGVSDRPTLLAKQRAEELVVLEKLRIEAAMPEWYPHQ